MQILFVNAMGAGYADRLDIQEGTTVSQLFEEKVGGAPDAFMIRVNREITTADYVLQEDDKVTATPVRIEGADA